MSPWALWAWGLAGLVALMSLLWLLQLRTRNAGVVDVGWAYGLGALAVLYGMLGAGHPHRRALVAGLAGAWSLRLAGYLLFDRVLGRPEDARYRELRESWGERAQPKLFLFFLAQALLDALLSLPFLVIAFDERPPGWREALASVVWLAAVSGESLADRQLARFRADPAGRGRTCREGLWRYSRHPNYFFEWLHWWAYVTMAPLSPAGGLSLLGPAAMLLFLYKVTGIPATEAHALSSRSDYADYQRRTSAFIPWFPKSV